jgi:hypothetical protein
MEIIKIEQLLRVENSAIGTVLGGFVATYNKLRTSLDYHAETLQRPCHSHGPLFDLMTMGIMGMPQKC